MGTWHVAHVLQLDFMLGGWCPAIAWSKSAQECTHQRVNCRTGGVLETGEQGLQLVWNMALRGRCRVEFPLEHAQAELQRHEQRLQQRVEVTGAALQEVEGGGTWRHRGI